MQIGDLVKLHRDLYVSEIVLEWGIGIILHYSPAYETVSVFWPNKEVERVFSLIALEKI
jgi:hypothetical protein